MRLTDLASALKATSFLVAKLLLALFKFNYKYKPLSVRNLKMLFVTYNIFY